MHAYLKKKNNNNLIMRHIELDIMSKLNQKLNLK